MNGASCRGGRPQSRGQCPAGRSTGMTTRLRLVADNRFLDELRSVMDILCGTWRLLVGVRPTVPTPWLSRYRRGPTENGRVSLTGTSAVSTTQSAVSSALFDLASRSARRRSTRRPTTLVATIVSDANPLLNSRQASDLPPMTGAATKPGSASNGSSHSLRSGRSPPGPDDWGW